MVEFEFMIHSTLNLVSGFLLIIIGIIAILRNKKARTNQFIAGFFFSLAVYEFFDGFTAAFHKDPSLDLLNGLRDVAIAFLILSLSFALLTVLVINYGENVILKPERLIIGGGVVAAFIVLGILGDSQQGMMGMGDGMAMNMIVNRNELGFIGITGSILFFSTLIIILLLVPIKNIDDDAAKSKLMQLFSGFLLIITVVFILDLRLIIPEIGTVIIQNDWFHILLHVILFTGELIILRVFWIPLNANQSSTVSQVTMT